MQLTKSSSFKRVDQASLHVYTHVYTELSNLSTRHVYTHVHIHVHTHFYTERSNVSTRHAYTHLCTHARAHVYAYLYAGLHTCMYPSLYT